VGNFIDDAMVQTFQDTITKVREDLGRTIQIYYKTGEPTVVNGTYDPINKESVGYSDSLTYSETVYTVKNVIIHWGPEPNPYMDTPGGRLDVGQCRLSVNLKKVLVDQSDVNGDTYFDNCRQVIVDGKTCKPIGPVVKTGLRDLFTCICICKIAE
jgi:hypothetical protein